LPLHGDAPIKYEEKLTSGDICIISEAKNQEIMNLARQSLMLTNSLEQVIKVHGHDLTGYDFSDSISEQA
jgi:hypothetical protein